MVKKKWANTAFDGQGAKRYGGRWNSRGVPCVYLSQSISLSCLEIMVHLENYHILKYYQVFQLELRSKDILILPQDEYPDDWHENPAPASTAMIGDEWLSGKTSLALAVPSAVVNLEMNYLLNPFHRHFDQCISKAELLDFGVDQRLLDTYS